MRLNIVNVNLKINFSTIWKKIVTIVFLYSILSCESNTYSDLIETNTTITLKWNKAYADDSIDKSLIGLKWALSYVGATLPSSNTGFLNTENPNFFKSSFLF